MATALLVLGFGAGARADFDGAMSAYEAQDYDTAMTEFESLAAAGEAKAQYQLGVMYAGGYGVTADNVEAVAWYRRAAEQGISDAQYDLGHSYAAGIGVVDDQVHAHKWFNLTAAGLPQGGERDRAVMARNDIEARLSAAQIEEAQRLATIWHENREP